MKEQSLPVGLRELSMRKQPLSKIKNLSLSLLLKQFNCFIKLDLSFVRGLKLLVEIVLFCGFRLFCLILFLVCFLPDLHSISLSLLLFSVSHSFDNDGFAFVRISWSRSRSALLW